VFFSQSLWFYQQFSMIRKESYHFLSEKAETINCMNLIVCQLSHFALTCGSSRDKIVLGNTEIQDINIKSKSFGGLWVSAPLLPKPGISTTTFECVCLDKNVVCTRIWWVVGVVKQIPIGCYLKD